MGNSYCHNNICDEQGIGGVGVNIQKKLIKYNYSSRNGKKIENIVIHDTGNKKKGAGANNHFLYFNGGNRSASAHYFVDDKEIIQLVEDSNAAWHVGDGKGKFGITNSNSIGIEICVNSDSDYDKAVQNTIELTKYLMNLHSVPLERVVRHYDASRKNCPASMAKDNWKSWKAFKAQLQEKPINKVRVNIKGKVIDIDGVIEYDTNKMATNYVSVRQLAEAMGYIVDWDNNNKVVLIK